MTPEGSKDHQNEAGEKEQLSNQPEREIEI